MLLLCLFNMFSPNVCLQHVRPPKRFTAFSTLLVTLGARMLLAYMPVHCSHLRERLTAIRACVSSWVRRMFFSLVLLQAVCKLVGWRFAAWDIALVFWQRVSSCVRSSLMSFEIMSVGVAVFAVVYAAGNAGLGALWARRDLFRGSCYRLKHFKPFGMG